MNNSKISWQRLDKNVLKLKPDELLNASVKWNRNIPEHENWLALIKPTKHNEKYYCLSLSLNAYYKFSQNIQELLQIEFKTLLTFFYEEEINDIKNEELEKGNSGIIYIIKDKIARIIVPVRLLDKTMNIFEIIFSNNTNCIEKDYECD